MQEVYSVVNWNDFYRIRSMATAIAELCSTDKLNPVDLTVLETVSITIPRMAMDLKYDVNFFELETRDVVRGLLKPLSTYEYYDRALHVGASLQVIIKEKKDALKVLVPEERGGAAPATVSDHKPKKLESWGDVQDEALDLIESLRSVACEINGDDHLRKLWIDIQAWGDLQTLSLNAQGIERAFTAATRSQDDQDNILAVYRVFSRVGMDLAVIAYERSGLNALEKCCGKNGVDPIVKRAKTVTDLFRRVLDGKKPSFGGTDLKLSL